MESNETSTQNPVDLIINRTGMTLEQIASICGISWQSVQQWRKRGSIPARHIKTLSAKTKIPKRELAPELY